MRTADGKLVEKVRVVSSKRYLWNGKELALEIKLVDPETQKQVPSAQALEILDHYSYKLLDEDGKELSEKQIQYFSVEPDKPEQLVRHFDRTKVIHIPEENWVPSIAMDGFLLTSVYEIFSPDEEIARQLYEEAEKRLKADQVGITTFSWGRGFQQYYCFLCPLQKNGQFVWLMKLTDTKLQYNHMQDVPAEVKLPIREAPTLETLPPVQALVVATTPRRK